MEEGGMTQYAESRLTKMARKKLRKPGDLQDLKRKLWQAILESERILLSSDDDELVLRAVHALTQAAMSYSKILEAGALEERLKVLEAAVLMRGRAA
jgi:hypothetical protein